VIKVEISLDNSLMNDGRGRSQWHLSKFLHLYCQLTQISQALYVFVRITFGGGVDECSHTCLNMPFIVELNLSTSKNCAHLFQTVKSIGRCHSGYLGSCKGIVVYDCQSFDIV
jgi:hypothetical protein